MISWKAAIMQLDSWILFQEKNNPNFTIRMIKGRITDMIFGTTLEELRDSEFPGDKEEYERRVKEGEIEMPR